MRKILLALGLCLACSISAFSSGFWLKVRGGIATINGGDYNLGATGSNDIYRLLFSNVSGVLSKLDRGLDLGIEAGLQVSRRLTLGVSLGYLSTRKKDTVEYDWEIPLASFHDITTITPHFFSIPVMLNLYYFFPLGPVRLNLGLGAGVYLCRFNYDNHFSSTQFDWKYDYSWNATKVVWGSQCGLGVEVPVGRQLFVSLDLVGRYAQVGNIRGQGRASGSLEGSPYFLTMPDQYFWYYELLSGGASYPQTAFQAFEPRDAAISNVRKAHFCFTGFAASVGLKIVL